MKALGLFATILCAGSLQLLGAVGLGADPGEEAKWISPRGRGGPLATAYLRKELSNAKAVSRVVWKTSGLGVYEAKVNGEVVSGFLEPGYTDVTKCRHEFTHDVTAVFRKERGAPNRLEVGVSCSWWADGIESGNYWKKRKDGFDPESVKPAFRGTLEIVYEDGTTDAVVTDESWSAAWDAGTPYAGIYEGEDHVFGRGTCPSSPAEENHDFRGEIRPSPCVPAVRRDDLRLVPVGAWVWKGVVGAEGTNAFGTVRILRRYARSAEMSLETGETLVVDFGQNCAFVPEVEFEGREGTVVEMRPAEMLNDGNGAVRRGNDGPEGSVLRANYRSARSMAKVTLSGRGVEKYVPRYTFFGGRYLSITATGTVKLRSLAIVPVTAIGKDMERGSLVTGSELVNRLVRNVRWGMYSNYVSVPTDCPQRDERLGWTADADVFAATATYLADVRTFLRKYLADLRDGVDVNGVYPAVAPVSFIGPQGYKFGWTDAGVLVTDKLWWYYADREAVEENWTAMDRYVRHVASFRGATKRAGGGWQYADWLSFENYEAHMDGSKDPKGFEDWWCYLGGCYLLLDAEAMVRMAEGTGRPAADVAYYRSLVRETRAYLRKRFFEADGLVDRRYRGLQCAHVFAIKCGLVEGAARAKTAEALVSLIEGNGNRLSTGFLGTAFLLQALTDVGRTDVAYTLLLQEECPSWLFPVRQGATTVWERWNGYTKADGFAAAHMNSFNHYAFGSVVGWLFETAAGIRPTSPGYATYAVDPKPDRRLGSLEASFVTPKGRRLSVKWRYDADGVCRIE